MTEYREGQTATNPKTGQKVVYRGGQWVNAGGSPPPAKQTAAEIKQRVGAQTKLLRAQSAERQLGRISELYDRNFKGVGPGSVLEYLPTPARKEFDAAANNMRPLLKPLIRDPGEGTFTDADQALLDSLIPDGWRQDADNEERIRGIRAMIGDLRSQYGQQYGGKQQAPAVVDWNDIP